MSFEQHNSSLDSPVAAMADPRKCVADRDSNLPKTGCFFVARRVRFWVNCYFHKRLGHNPSRPAQVVIVTGSYTLHLAVRLLSIYVYIFMGPLS